MWVTTFQIWKRVVTGPTWILTGLVARCVARAVMPFTFTWIVVVVTEHRTNFWCSPCNTDSSFSAGLGVGCYSCTETLTVSTSITGTGVFHTVLKEQSRIYLLVARLESLSCDDAALHLSPVVTVGSGSTWVDVAFCVGTSA